MRDEYYTDKKILNTIKRLQDGQESIAEVSNFRFLKLSEHEFLTAKAEEIT